MPIKINLLLVFFAIFLGTSMTQTQAQQPPNTVRDVVRKHSNGKPYVVVYIKPNGEIVKEEVFYSSGKMEWEGYYKKSIEDGEWKYYYPSGKIKSKQSYLRGKEHGVFVDYDEGGKVIKQTVFQNGKQISERK
jgi:antitoxin component YwqK of YwqJK toxin-antitoxin module